jgi:hypothetical protein
MSLISAGSISLDSTFKDYNYNCCTLKIHLFIENYGRYLELFAGCPNDPEPLLCVVLQQHGELSWNWCKKKF